MEEYLYILVSILILPGVLYGVFAQLNVTRTFNNLNHVESTCGKTACEVARMMLDSAGLYDVKIQKIRGDLTDNYDPTKKILSLSESTYDSKSVASIGVSAHEVGHAIQHKEGYAPLLIRNKFVPLVNFSSGMFWIVFVVGILLSTLAPLLYRVGEILIWVSVAMYGSSTLFYLITLPVEYNASNRALANLEKLNILNQDELPLSKKVLSAAAQTYVATLITSALYFLRFLLQIIMMFKRRD